MNVLENLSNAITIMIKNFEKETDTRIGTIRVVRENKKTNYIKIKLVKEK